MSALKFVDSHNMVAFLAKPTESDGFEQILDFLNANPIKYALMLQALVDGKKVIIAKTSVRRYLQLENAEGIKCLPNADIFEQLALMGAKSTAWNEFSSTMASARICLSTNQKFNFSKYIFESMVKNVDSSVKFLMYPRFVQVFLDKQVGDMSTHDEIFVTPSHTKKVFSNMKRVGKGFSGAVTPLFPTMMVQAQQEQGEDEAVNEENVSKHSNDPLLSGEDRLKLQELMTLCTNLQNRVLDLEHTKTTQALKIDNLKRRVKKLEKKQRSRTHGLRRLYKVGLSARVVSSEDEGLGEDDASKQGRKIHDIDADEDITLENVHDEDMFGVNDLEGDVIVVESEVADNDVNLSVDEVTLAQALAALKSVSTVIRTTTATIITTVSPRPREKWIVFHEQEQAPTLIVSSQQPTQVKDKGKGKMVEEELVKKMSKKELLKLDEELALKLQAEEDEEERLAREKAQKVEEANIAWDDIQAKVEADYQLAQRLQAQEQEELFDADKATLFVQLLIKRRKFISVKRAEEKRNKPPTKAQ
ncbi:hypothetical protein Tco_1230698 [Tanacetum coccineum]